MPIAVSGSQGSGKTTLLNRLYELGFELDEFKVSRSVQALLGKTLAECTSTVEDMLSFQELIVDAKFKNDATLATNTLVERSFADIAAYLDLWVAKFDIAELTPHQGRIEAIRQKCIDYQRLYGKCIIVPQLPHIMAISLSENDPNRAPVELCDEFQENLMRFFLNINTQLYFINEHTVEDRAIEAAKFINQN